MSEIFTIGTDLAKNVSTAHGVDATGKLVLVRPGVPHAKLLELPTQRTSLAHGLLPHHWQPQM